MRLRNAPLVHVLAQVTFPPVPDWAEREGELRAKLYNAGFQRYRPAEMREVTVEFPAQGAPPAVQHRVASFAEFIERDERFAFQSGPSSFVLHSTGYRGFDHFLQLATRGLQLLGESMGVRLVDRIGLRYVDLIQVQDGERLSNFVSPGLLGFPFREARHLGVSQVAFMTHSAGITEIGTLAVRSMVLPPGRFVPQDLDIGGLRPPGHVDAKLPSLALDFDHYTIFSGPAASLPPLDYDVDRIGAHLQALHQTVRAAFDAVVTEHAISTWGGWEDIGEE